MESFEKQSQERKNEMQEVIDRFENSLTVFGETESIEMHLEHLRRLPERLVQIMRKKGLKVVLGEGNMLDLMSRVSGIKALVLSLIEKFRYREREVETGYRGWARVERQKPRIPMGCYDGLQKTVFVGTYENEGEGQGKIERETSTCSPALHEYGHGLGHLLNLNKDKQVEEAHLRLYLKLSNYLQQGKAGDVVGRAELLAESFAGYFSLPKDQFVAMYDESMYLFWEQTIAAIIEENIGGQGE